MKIFQEPCCSILGVLLFFLLQVSCADPGAEVVHKAVGDSLELIAVYPKDGLEVQWKHYETVFAEYRKNDFNNLQSKLFHDRLKMSMENISVTVTDLRIQDSGNFSIVAEVKSVQHPTKTIELHVHDRITDVQIKYNHSWSQFNNTCTFHLRCLASGDPNPSYSWTRHQVKTQGSHLNISLRLAESATLNCTANNTISVKYTTKTVVCTEKSDDSSVSSGFRQEYLLIVVGVCVVVIVIFSATVSVCCRWKRNKGQGDSEAGITVYEDVNADVTAKKRSESVVNGMSIYETVDDTKIPQKLPQTLYDKINYQRHPAVSANTSSPYQEVL